ncbi:hypothetical protein [Pseudopedobacter beijingensis]|uniref:Uncharacterized protein n=1 Tax=Pseudopedobacter beijingensis TaxID=1207056 RepID=A0ABW4ICZ5_9SPHI
MNVLILEENEFFGIKTENLLDFPLLAAFLSGKNENGFSSDYEDSSLENMKFNEEPRIDLLSEK